MTRSWLFTLALFSCGPKTPPPPPAEPAQPDPATRMMSDIAALDFQNLGSPVLKWDWTPPVKMTAEDPHELLVVLVDFPDVPFDRFAGDKDQAQKLAAYYQEELFDSTYERVDTISHYYAAQSDGAYHVDGKVLPPVRLGHPLQYYGSPFRPAGGDWRNDERAEDLVEEALGLARTANPDVDWSRYDRWDPRDYDKDGVTDEPDGYLDHFVMVYAGKGQHACQALYQLDQRLNPNVGAEALDALSKKERACADRLWPHRGRVMRRVAEGPEVGDVVNHDGGIEVNEKLWVFDYNMQAEYTSVDTFIHEFGHSIGLPDVYSRTSSNSTGPWELMSSTAVPSPQNLSSWSRLMLGWIKPQVVQPPAWSGQTETTVYLADLGAPASAEANGVVRSALVALPPKVRQIDLTDLPESSGSLALYSGQGNEMDRMATVKLDLAGVQGEVKLEADAWWDIEAGWDFAYFETSEDGLQWTRRLPTDRQMMPSEHGHDGPGTTPGFTGLSGDLDGDGKNESSEGCDPTEKVASGEDRVGAEHSPCEDATWVKVAFDLTPWAGKTVWARFHYFADTAAVEPGILIDNVTVTGTEGAILAETFEGEPGPAWEIDGWVKSPGHHTLLVPHYYLLEYRDPYDQVEGTKDYDETLARGSLLFWWNPERKGMSAVHVRARPGVVAWYANGAHAWSENDPALNGPGKGYALVVDSWPNELSVPGWAGTYKGTPDAFDTHFEVDAAQEQLQEAYFRTFCFVRDADYYPVGMDAKSMKAWCRKPPKQAPVRSLKFGELSPLFSYEIADVLPGPERDTLVGAGELFDYRTRDGATTWRMRDRGLRYVHTLDAPFSPTPFPRGAVYYDVEGGKLVEREATDAPAVTTFDDADPARWLNPNLPFGGVDVPTEGLSFVVEEPGEGAPAGAKAKVTIRWATDQGEAAAAE